MEIKCDTPIEVTQKQLQVLTQIIPGERNLNGTFAHRQEETPGQTTKYYIKVWQMDYKNEIIKILHQNK